MLQRHQAVDQLLFLAGRLDLVVLAELAQGEVGQLGELRGARLAQR